MLVDPKTGEIINPAGDPSAVAYLNTPEIKQARLLAAFQITHPIPVTAADLAAELAKPINIFNPGPAPESAAPAPGSQEEIDAVLQIILNSQPSVSPLTPTVDVAPPHILWHNKVTGENRC